MRILLILFIPILLSCQQFSSAQNRFSTFEVDLQIKDTFSFTEKWKYPWNVYKDPVTGEFHGNMDGDEPLDTTHRHYTAALITNVMGGYEINYCEAVLKSDTIFMEITDGAPAYFNSFYISIHKDLFSFKPFIVYPVFNRDVTNSYEVISQKMVLNKPSYQVGDTIIGYINMEIEETVHMKGKKDIRNVYYLRGYLKTPVLEK